MLKVGPQAADTDAVDLNAVLRRVAELGASDVHFKNAKPPMLRRDGAIEVLEGVEPLTADDLKTILDAVTAHVPERRRGFEATGELDFSYQAAELPRFRVNAFRQRGHTSLAFRLIPRTVPSFEELRLPPGVARLAGEHRGLVLVTGATGAGKSTTLAAVVNHINATRQQHIVTIEDPIEMLHEDRSCIVNQREVGIDTESFGQALRRALRQDPDVILIGELRDAETAETALQAAESGHLVLSTLHTLDAAETIGRLVEFFPAVKQQMIRSILAGVLRGVVSQRLLPRIGGGRVAAVEVMVTNDRIAELIRENRSEEISAAISEGSYYDMRTLADALMELVLEGLVDREVAASAAPNRHDFLLALDHAEKLRHAEALLPSVGDLMPDQAGPPVHHEPAAESAPALRLVRLPAMGNPFAR
jgi:twitching motility protein PilT